MNGLLKGHNDIAVSLSASLTYKTQGSYRGHKEEELIKSQLFFQVIVCFVLN